MIVDIRGWREIAEGYDHEPLSEIIIGACDEISSLRSALAEATTALADASLPKSSQTDTCPPRPTAGIGGECTSLPSASPRGKVTDKTEAWDMRERTSPKPVILPPNIDKVDPYPQYTMPSASPQPEGDDREELEELTEFIDEYVGYLTGPTDAKILAHALIRSGWSRRALPGREDLMMWIREYVYAPLQRELSEIAERRALDALLAKLEGKT